MKAIIMAGGKGTRISSLNADVPKPMISVCGKPVLEYQINCLQSQGLKEILMVTGHLGEVIQAYFGTGEKYGVHIEYFQEKEPLGTAGALFFLKSRIHGDFFLINGDIVFDVDLHRMEKAHIANGGAATILTHPNSHPYDSGVILADREGKVTGWLNKEEKRQWYKNRVNAGIHILSPAVFQYFNKPERKDLDRDILRKLIQTGELFCYQTPEYVQDMGTPERYYAVERDIFSGLVQKRNLRNRQRAVFLDRDGTINEYVGFLKTQEQMKLLEGAGKAIRLLNESGYLVIVVTNQPVIARGEVSENELEEIHNKMETLLGEEGACVDDIFYCPHHPDKGFEGERAEFKIPCACRKPKPGMLAEAAEKYNIDLAQSWMIGDGENDMEAGRRAGCRTVRIGDGTDGRWPCYSGLYECVQHIILYDNGEK